MRSKIYIGGPGRTSLETVLEQNLAGTSSLGLAVAYISVYGVEFLKKLAQSASIGDVRLIADIRDGISHPQAFRICLNEHWRVRVAQSEYGTFHPKLYMAGNGFANDGSVLDPRMCLIGSNNLTKSGLNNNIECSIGILSNQSIPGVGKTFKKLWAFGTKLDTDKLEEYELYFAERNRKRTSDDLLTLGVSDESREQIEEFAADPKKKKSRVSKPTMRTSAATTAWAGLQSFTGEYRFQIEFPRAAGEVLGQLLGESRDETKVNVLCDDGHVREMTYRYYLHNSMFRLNVPNDVPGVQEARSLHSGVAIVAKVEHSKASIQLRILHDASMIDDMVKRSLALGTLHQTTTRLYGWY